MRTSEPPAGEFGRTFERRINHGVTNMFGPIGMPELILIFLVALLVFGPRKLPELGKSLGRGLAEFKKASDDLKRTIEDEIEQGKNQVSSVRDEVAAVRDQAAELKNTVASTAGTTPPPPTGSPAAPEARSGDAAPPAAPIRPA
jgi:sec-independent protein translocase protein TatA